MGIYSQKTPVSMFLKLLFAIAAVMMCVSCMHAPLPNLPKDWQGVVVPPKALEDKPDVAGMQLFIMYGSIGCSHTALRFHCPGKGALFWDPGGGYGSEGLVTVTKHYDVVTRNVPTANDYLHWRTLIATEATEVFIWERNDGGICELYDRIDAASRGIRMDGFTTTTAGLFCSAATSRFLHDYAGRLLTVDKWGLPHNLSRQIYQQGNADRIYIVRHNENTIERYTPNP
jgi:hypothetical protein